MGRNNVIVVAQFRGRYFVLVDLNADTEWNEEWVRAHVKQRLCYRNRAYALERAHDRQLQLETQYGVREMYIEDIPVR